MPPWVRFDCMRRAGLSEHAKAGPFSLGFSAPLQGKRFGADIGETFAFQASILDKGADYPVAFLCRVVRSFKREQRSPRRCSFERRNPFGASFHGITRSFGH